MNKCLVCDLEIEGKARTCSPKCRKILSRQQSVTKNVSVTSPKVESVTFQFRVVKNKDDDRPNPVRSERYWYDIPLVAVPIKQKGWPDMPDYMNGRQYFLWWKNDFKVNEDPSKGELGQPIIHNPGPVYTKLDYYQAGDNSRRWGA